MSASQAELQNSRDNLSHALEFTKIENTAIVYVLRGWFAALVATPGAIEMGDDAWSFTTLFEHFDSKLNAEPNTRTATNLKILATLAAKAKEAQDKLDSLAPTNDEDERINKALDAFVNSILIGL